MNNIEELLDYDCIDYRKLLIIKAKSLGLSDDQVYLLIIMMTLIDMNIKPITPAKLSQFCQLSLSKIDEVLISLVDKHFLSRMNGSLDLKPLYKQLLDIKVEENTDMDLISVFEDAFGRSLSQREIEIINSFKINGFSDSMIVEALNEAVKSGVINFRYIEKILDNWQKYGVKKRYAPKHEENQQFDQKIKDYKWWDNE
ncbi:MAG: DnaD domain protein [Erysipelotrichaceae bacterium]|nr:DnaD domain protein [Erysipelotrichaceae bacterium]